MAKDPQKGDATDAEVFARSAARKSQGFVREHIEFLRSTGKWWLAPILLALAIAGALVVVGGTVAAPFIYAVF